jgi:hypothetical protein
MRTHTSPRSASHPIRTLIAAYRFATPAVALLLAILAAQPPARAACCYFAAKDKDVNQPAQKAFITWDPAEHVESFTVQPRFEGNAQDFGMIIPTPGRPRLDEMPRDFFKELAVFTILKKREYPESKILPRPPATFAALSAVGGAGGGGGFNNAGAPRSPNHPHPNPLPEYRAGG